MRRRCLLSNWGICPSGGPVPFFEFRTFTSKARAFCLYPLPSLPCQPRAGCTGKPVAARGLVSGRGPRRQAWEGWSEAEGLPCKRPGAGLPGCKVGPQCPRISFAGPSGRVAQANPWPPAAS